MGDERPGTVTNGVPDGTSGWPGAGFWSAAGVIILIALTVAVVNALSTVADRPEFAVWEAWTWELTSFVMAVALIWLPWQAVRRATPGTASWHRLLVIHGGAALAFAALHVAGFVALREAVYALQGWNYDFGPAGDRFLYELRKDVLTYLAFASVFWISRSLTAKTGERAQDDPVAASFDIRDGARIIRVSADQIVAVTAAGNYAEFILADGRRPLMRTTLARLEVELATLGLIRTHRSWLVNTAKLTGLEPDGSGDWTVELGQVRAPVSRRYPRALERLRN